MQKLNLTYSKIKSIQTTLRNHRRGNYQTNHCIPRPLQVGFHFFSHKNYTPLVLKLTMPKAIYNLYIIVSTPQVSIK